MIVNMVYSSKMAQDFPWDLLISIDSIFFPKAQTWLDNKLDNFSSLVIFLWRFPNRPLCSSVFYLQILFIYFWLHWVCVAVCWLSSAVVRGLLTSYDVQASHGLSCCRTWTLIMSSVVGVHGLSCSIAWGIFLDQRSRAFTWAGEFLTTGPPGKASAHLFGYSLWGCCTVVILDFFSAIALWPLFLDALFLDSHILLLSQHCPL